MTTSNYLGIHKVLNASSAFMSNFFPNAPPSSMQFAPDGLQGSTAPQETTPSQSLGNTPNIPQYATQGPTLPPLQHKGDGVLSLPHHGFTPQRSQSMASQADNVPSTATPNTASDYDHVTDDFHPYNPTERSEARNSKGSPKRVTSGDSPEGKSVNGRRRTRTKVVAWDPKDLEAIYKRKEVEKEDWDTICRVSTFFFDVLVCRTYLTFPRITRPGQGWLCANRSSYVNLIHLDPTSFTYTMAEIERQENAGGDGPWSCAKLECIECTPWLISS